MNSKLDSSSFEAIIGLLCRSGRLSDAYSMVERFTHDCNVGNTAQVENDNFDGGRGGGGGDHGGPLENAAIYLSLARACAVRGLHQESAKWLTLTASALQISENAKLKNAMLKRFQEASSPPDSNSNNEGRIPRRTVKKSTELFLQHREDEIKHGMQQVEDYLAATTTLKLSSPSVRLIADEEKMQTIFS